MIIIIIIGMINVWPLGELSIGVMFELLNRVLSKRNRAVRRFKSNNLRYIQVSPWYERVGIKICIYRFSLISQFCLYFVAQVGNKGADLIDCFSFRIRVYESSLIYSKKFK